MNKIKKTILFIIFLLLISPVVSEAKSISTSYDFLDSSWNDPPSFLFQSFNWFGWQKLYDFNITLEYKVQIKRGDTGTVVADGDNIPVGTQLELNFLPDEDRNLSWSSRTLDTDYRFFSGGNGAWASTVAAPDPICAGSAIESYTQSSPITFTDISGTTQTVYLYIPLVVGEETKTINTSSNLSCGSLLESFDRFNNPLGYIMDCTVSAEGPITVSFNYGDTYGKMYGAVGSRFTSGWSLDRDTTVGCYEEGLLREAEDIPFGVGFGDFELIDDRLPFNSKTISYSFNGTPVIPANTAPNPPTIDGNTAGETLTDYTFGFTATDPESDAISYGIDWDNNGVVDEWLPNTGTTTSGTRLTSVKSWGSVASYTFQALAQDELGLQSTWSQHVINITEVTENGVCGASNNVCLAGSLDDVADSVDYYQWYCRGTGGGSDSPMCIDSISGAPSFSLTCSSSPAPAYAPTPVSVTFTANTDADTPTYQWLESDDSLISGETGSTFTRSYSDIGLGRVKVAVMDINGETDIEECSVNVACNPNIPPGTISACSSGTQTIYETCTNSGWTTTTQACVGDPEAAFTFSPSVVGTGGQCNIVIEGATNVSTCSLYKGSSVDPISSTIDSFIDVASSTLDIAESDGVSVSPGRYTLECTSPDDGAVPETFNSAVCIENPNIIEN